MNNPFISKNFGQYALPDWAEKLGVGMAGGQTGFGSLGAALSPMGAAAKRFSGVKNTGIASGLIRGLGGFLGARDRIAKEEAQNAMTQGLLEGGLPAAIRNLQGMDSFYAQQALHPMALAKAAREREQADLEQARAQQMEAENRAFERQKWMQQARLNAQAAAADKAFARKQWFHDLQQAQEQKRAEQEHALQLKMAEMRTAGNAQANYKRLQKEQFDQEKVLRNEFQANTKTYYDSMDAFKKMEAVAKQKSPAASIAMVQLFYKSYDPLSTVSDSEKRMFDEAGSFGDRIGSLLRMALRGKAFSEKQKKEILNAAKAATVPYQSRFDQTKKNYTEIANAYGLNPSHVLNIQPPKLPKLPTYSEEMENEKPGYMLTELMNRIPATL